MECTHSVIILSPLCVQGRPACLCNFVETSHAVVECRSWSTKICVIYLSQSNVRRTEKFCLVSDVLPLGRPARRREDNIKVDLQEAGWGGIGLAQDVDRWWAFVNAVMNLRLA